MTSEHSTAPAAPWAIVARDLYLTGMAVFVLNIVIGILNGADADQFDRNQIATHVHAGTVGWLTLAIIGGTTLLFRAMDRRLALALIVAVPIYVLAFYTGNFMFRALGGTVLLVIIAWLVVWLWRQFLAGERTLPRLAVTLGLTSFGYGAVLGVLLQIGFAANLIPARRRDRRARLGHDVRLSRAGRLRLPRVARPGHERPAAPRGHPSRGPVPWRGHHPVALLTGAEQIGGMLYLLAELFAVVLFVIRIWPKSLRTNWLAATPMRHLAAATVWVVIALVLFMYLVFSVISSGQPLTDFLGLLIASDHVVYIGVVTNGALGVL